MASILLAQELNNDEDGLGSQGWYWAENSNTGMREIQVDDEATSDTTWDDHMARIYVLRDLAGCNPNYFARAMDATLTQELAYGLQLALHDRPAAEKLLGELTQAPFDTEAYRVLLPKTPPAWLGFLKPSSDGMSLLNPAADPLAELSDPDTHYWAVGELPTLQEVAALELEARSIALAFKEAVDVFGRGVQRIKVLDSRNDKLLGLAFDHARLDDELFEHMVADALDGTALGPYFS